MPGAAVAQPAESAETSYQRGLVFFRQKPADYGNALFWYQQAAAKNYAPAQNDIGFMYERGFGVVRDQSEAARWYRLAATQGYAYAQTNLGLMYNDGRGVSQSYAEAMKWYRLAAGQSEPWALNNLGVLYRDGLGVPRDLDQAVVWFRKAEAGGNMEAPKSLRQLASLDRGMAPWGDMLAGKEVRIAISQIFSICSRHFRSDSKPETSSTSRFRSRYSPMPSYALSVS